MPVVLVLCFVTAVALTLYALVFLRALLVNDWIWSSSRPSSNRTGDFWLGSVAEERSNRRQG